jgi:hypothetical protein
MSEVLKQGIHYLVSRPLSMLCVCYCWLVSASSRPRCISIDKQKLVSLRYHSTVIAILPNELTAWCCSLGRRG